MMRRYAPRKSRQGVRATFSNFFAILSVFAVCRDGGATVDVSTLSPRLRLSTCPSTPPTPRWRSTTGRGVSYCQGSGFCAASLAAEVGLPKARTALETLAVAGRYARDVIAAALVALLEEQNR